MEQIFRIEIPVEAIDKTETGALQQLESALQKVVSLMTENKNKSKEAFSGIDKGAKQAADAIDKVATSATDASESFDKVEQAADDAGNAQAESANTAAAASQKAESAVEDVADAYDETADAAKKAGQEAGSSFDGAATKADKFTQRMEKSNAQIEKMSKTKIQLIMEALDRASPVLKDIWGYAKRLGAKAWTVAVRMKDFITAPFRKLYQMISSPITIALSVAGIGLSAGDLVTTFNEFETGMSAVRALTGATNDDFMLLKETAKDLGATTSFSASEASQGMQYLAMAGWDTNEIVAAMPGLLDLAAAGATDLGVAADIVSDVMTAMGMAAGEAGRAADVFAKTATSSNTTIEGLGDTLKYAAPIAHSFGLSLEEVSAMAGMMANAGIKGSMAGTAIRSSLLSMASPTAEAAKLMKQLGLSFTNTDGSMKSMSAIVANLEKSFDGLTESQRLQYTETLFGTYASSAWLGVINQGAAAYDTFTESLENANGAASDMARIRLDNLAGDMEELGGAVETAKLEIMDKLDPYLRAGVQWLTGKIPAVQSIIENAIDSIAEKAKGIKEHLQGVFNSNEWNAADGFAEKMFVAWDKIIVEPFGAWWNGGGRDTVLGIVERVGSSMGEMLKGLFLGAFSAITGQSVDFEGFNMSAIAKAGVESAITFGKSFMDSLDLGGLAAKLPAVIAAIIKDAFKLVTGGSSTSLLSAIIVGKGAATTIGGISTVTKWVGGLKAAFAGTSAAATAAGTATASVGASAAAAGAGVAKSVTALGALKGVLAAIPVWGWIAAAVITAGAIAITHYARAQEQHRQELLHMGDSAAEAVDKYREACRNVNEAAQDIQDAEIANIVVSARTTPMTEADYQTLVDDIDRLEQRKIELQVKFEDEGISDADRAIIEAQILEIEAQQLMITVTIGKVNQQQVTELENEVSGLELAKAQVYAMLNAPTEEQVADMNTLLATLQFNRAQIETELSAGGLSQEEIDALNQQIQDLQIAELIIKAKLGTITQEEITIAEGMAQQLAGTTEGIVLKAVLGLLTPEDIAALNAQIANIEWEKAQIQAKINAGGLSQEEIDALNARIAELEIDELILKAAIGEIDDDELTELITDLEGQTIDLYAKIHANQLTSEEIATINGQIEAIEVAQIEIQARIDAGGLSQEEVDALNAQIESLEVSRILLKSAIQPLTEEEIKKLAQEVQNIDAGIVEIEAQLANSGNLPQTEVDALNQQIDDLNARRVIITATLQTLTDGEVQGFVDTAARAAAVNPYDQSDQAQQEREIARLELEAEVYRQRGTVAEQVSARAGYQNEADELTLSAENYGIAAQKLAAIETDFRQLQAQANVMYERSNLDSSSPNYISDAQYNDWYEKTYMPGLQSVWERYNNEVFPYSYAAGDWMTSGENFSPFALVNYPDLFSDIFGMWSGDSEYATKKAAEKQSDADLQNQSLVNAYRAEAALIEANTFRGTSLEGMSVQELAANYGNLDAGQIALFKDAVNAIGQLNLDTGYIEDADKIDIMGLWKAAYGVAPTQAERTEGGATVDPRAAIDALATRNVLDANGDTLFTQMLKANEEQYAFASQQLAEATAAGADTTQYEEAIAALKEERQAIFDEQYNAVTSVVNSVAAIDEQIAATEEKIAELTARATELQAAYDTVAQIKAKYGSLSETDQVEFANSEEGAAALANVNAALESLSLDKITSLSQLSDALAAIEGAQGENTTAIDSLNESLAGLTADKIDALVAIENALATIQWNATNADRLKDIPKALQMSAADVDRFSQVSQNVGNCRDQVQQLKNKLDDLQGTYSVTVNVKYNFSNANFNPGSIGKNATGGIYDGAMLSWVAEDGPEAIIPLGNNRRERGLDLWLQAGEMLGVSEFADGGIMAPYSGALSAASEYFDDVDEGVSGAYPKGSGAFDNGDGDTTVSVTVSANPTFIIEGSDDEDIMDKLKGKQKELAEILGECFAEQIQDIAANQV